MSEKPRFDDTPVSGTRRTRGGMVLMAGQGGMVVISFLSTILLARVLSPADFGIVAMAIPLREIALMQKNLGFGDAAIQRQTVDQGQLSALFLANAALALLLACAGALAAPAIGAFFGSADVTSISYVYAIIILVYGLGAQHVAIVTRQMRFGMISVVSLAAAAAGLAAGLAYAEFVARDFWALVAMHVTNALVEVVVLCALSGWLPTRPRFDASVRGLMAFGRNMALSRVSQFVTEHMTTVVIGWWLGAVALGLYDRAMRLLTTPTSQLGRPLSRIALPVLSRAHGGDERYRRAYFLFLALVFAMISPAAIYVLLRAETLVGVLLGAHWLDVVPLLLWLAPVALSHTVKYSFGWLYFSQDRSGEYLRFMFRRSLLLVAVPIVVVPWGLEAYVAAYAILFVGVLTPAMAWQVTSKGPVDRRRFLGDMAPITGAMLGAAAGIEAVSRSIAVDTLPELMLAILSGYGAFLLAYALFPLGRRRLAEALELLAPAIGWRRPASA